MKRLLAAVLTVLVMGLLAWSGMRRPATPTLPGGSGSSASAGATGGNGPSPAESRVHALLESAWNGNVAEYLAAFDGSMRQRLEREVGERGREAFSNDLRAAARARKSHAVFAAEPDGDDVARVTVETVYPDRNERQTYRVDRTPAGWLVTEVETVRSHQPKARYGTQASYEAPEGVPVQTPGISVETGEEGTKP